MKSLVKIYYDAIKEGNWHGSKFPTTINSYMEIPSMFDTKCKMCGNKINKGQMFFYFPYAKIKTLCKTCGPINADKVNYRNH